MPLTYPGNTERKVFKQSRPRAREILIKEALAELDADELKRQGLAKKAYRKVDGEKLANARIEEKRKIDEYLQQRRLLFPKAQLAHHISQEPVELDDSPTMHKGKQKAVLLEENVRSQVERNASSATRSQAEQLSVFSHNLSPKSSTSSPPSTRKTVYGSSNSPPLRACMETFPLEKFLPFDAHPCSVHTNPHYWYFADEIRMHRIFPQIELRRVMELGLWHRDMMNENSEWQPPPLRKLKV